MIQYILQAATSFMEALIACMEPQSQRSIDDSDLSSITNSATPPYLPVSFTISSPEARISAPPDLSLGRFRQSIGQFTTNIGSSTEGPGASFVHRRRRSRLDLEPEMLAKIDGVLRSVDKHIRTRKRFDSRDPTAYKISLHSILSDNLLMEEFNNLVPEIKRKYPNLRKLITSPFGKRKFTFIITANQHLVYVNHLTPMQLATDSPLFGYFSCPCGKAWIDDQSFTNEAQQCGGCRSRCYPFYQQELERPRRNPMI